MKKQVKSALVNPMQKVNCVIVMFCWKQQQQKTLQILSCRFLLFINSPLKNVMIFVLIKCQNIPCNFAMHNCNCEFKELILTEHLVTTVVLTFHFSFCIVFTNQMKKNIKVHWMTAKPIVFFDTSSCNFFFLFNLFECSFIGNNIHVNLGHVLQKWAFDLVDRYHAEH